MIANIEATAGKAGAPIYHLKVVLNGTKPPIWRRLQVPGNANLGWLHAVLQVAVGWTNSHLHQFKVGEHCYSDPRHHFTEFEGDPEILDERKFILQQLAPREKDTGVAVHGVVPPRDERAEEGQSRENAEEER